MQLDFSILVKSFPYLLAGAWMTVKITSLSVAVGIIIGTIGGLMRVSKNPILFWLSTIYVEVIRGTPLLVQIFIVYFGLPSIGIRLTPYLSAVAALGINSGAYVSEIVRGGIQSISKGQMEAARSLGMSYGQAMRYVVLPQAMVRILPPLGNEFIALLKDSSLVSTIAIAELTRVGQQIITRTFQSFEIWIGVALFYFVMTFIMSRIVRFLESRLAIND